ELSLAKAETFFAFERFFMMLPPSACAPRRQPLCAPHAIDRPSPSCRRLRPDGSRSTPPDQGSTRADRLAFPDEFGVARAGPCASHPSRHQVADLWVREDVVLQRDDVVHREFPCTF